MRLSLNEVIYFQYFSEVPFYKSGPKSGPSLQKKAIGSCMRTSCQTCELYIFVFLSRNFIHTKFYVAEMRSRTI